jgi:hypothetical protein
MLLGQRWGLLLALIGSVPFWYSAILIFIWDRDLGFRKNSLTYWVFVWGMFPAFGVLEMVYCPVRLLEYQYERAAGRTLLPHHLARTNRSVQPAAPAGSWLAESHGPPQEP